MTKLFLILLSIIHFSPLFAQETNDAGARARQRLQQPVVLGPDDKPAFGPPPVGFDVKREDTPKGKVDTVQYFSKTVGNERKMLVYTPPGYSNKSKYPILYLLHGIGGDETEWFKYDCAPDIILDNLLADKKIVPMVVIFPNGRAQKNDRAEGDIFSHAKAFEAFENDLLHDIIPFVEKNYAVKNNRESRALAGLSMGGGQSLNFGLGNLDTFAWIGGFSSAPNTKAPAQLIPDLTETAKKLKLLWLSCGDQDGLINISQGLHAYLKENKIPHIWHVSPGAHHMPVWEKDLYFFSQQIFK